MAPGDADLRRARSSRAQTVPSRSAATASPDAVSSAAPFRALAAPRRAEIRDKGSRFLASAFPAADEEEARARLEEIRRTYPDATHHVWAWRFGAADGPRERSHDAGEPRGTAGPPVLQAIRTAGLLNLVLVVSRWFGGTKLGKGGLARAYGAAARAALEGAPSVAAVVFASLRVALPAELDGALRNLVARRGGRVEEASYDGRGGAALTLAVPAEARAALRSAIETLARGTARFEPPGPPGGAPRRRG